MTMNFERRSARAKFFCLFFGVVTLPHFFPLVHAFERLNNNTKKKKNAREGRGRGRGRGAVKVACSGNLNYTYARSLSDGVILLDVLRSQKRRESTVENNRVRDARRFVRSEHFLRLVASDAGE